MLKSQYAGYCPPVCLKIQQTVAELPTMIRSVKVEKGLSGGLFLNTKP